MTAAAPLASTSTVASFLREHRATRTPVRIAGARTWQHAGRAVTASAELSVAEDRGIVEYVPGDLTITARAGATLKEIAEATSEHGQFLTLDPWGGDAGTIGATVATATAGPRAAAFGLPRDVVLGMEFVDGTGRVIRAGGRVVKNVAGFDLVRLLTGSWGTLGVITEMTFRLRAVPEQRETIVMPLPDGPALLAALVQRLRALPFVPMAVQLVNPALARHLGLQSSTTLLAELGGNANAVAAQRDLLRSLAPDAASAGADLWTRLRGCDHQAAASWRWSALPTQFAALWARAADVQDAFVHGDPWRGVIRVVLPRGLAAMPAIQPADGRTIAEVLPSDAWSGVHPPARASDRLARDIRARFDPGGILNPGILGA